MHPEVAGRDCEQCQKYIFETTGKQRVNRETGQPVRRPAGQALPCRTPTGCPKGTPEEQRDLSPKNTQAYYHYLECKATGTFPDDGLVRYNAGLIHMAEGIAARTAAWELNQHLKHQTDLLLTVLTSRAV